jgi:hypothetical protein
MCFKIHRHLNYIMAASLIEGEIKEYQEKTTDQQQAWTNYNIELSQIHLSNSKLNGDS